MRTTPTFIGTSAQKSDANSCEGKYVSIGGEKFYQISHYDLLDPFFMSIASSTDHWLFVSSAGSLTAGRKNPEYALFPYYTVDKIHESNEHTGAKTIIRVNESGATLLWEPFSEKYEGVYSIERNLYKNTFGNKVIFEEINHDLQLSFKQTWANSDEYGIVRKAELTNLKPEDVSVEILDGLQNIVPAGVPMATQTRLSTLVDAYKKSELDPETGLGLFMLSAIIVDRAEPSEALRCNTVWSIGLDRPTHLLRSHQIKKFRKGLALKEEIDIRARRGAYFINKSIDLGVGENKTWYIVADVNQGPSAVAAIKNEISESNNIIQKIEKSINDGTAKLAQLVASSDGIQHTANEAMAARHFSNVLFNIMRGGVFHDNYEIQKDDYLKFAESNSPKLLDTLNAFFESLPSSFSYTELFEKAEENGNLHLIRLCYEYLPLTFSRRHGDPSRPWNKFSIEVKDEDGSDVLYYAGNWRDIFQNWEALAFSYPNYIEGMIAKFLNASTADGYNPYRITRDGIDWEKIEPEDPWSYIGYWGDHQIIYLQKLLEASHRHNPDKLNGLFKKSVFAFANVPYRIKSYEELLKNPYDTVDYDDDLDLEIEGRLEENGADAKMIWNKAGEVYMVSLAEKLLIPALVKLSNFVPEAGIWLNTQRPEWNDANNALVGNGVSMVTLYYLRRYQKFCKELFNNSGIADFELSEEVSTLFEGINNTFIKYADSLNGIIDDKTRREIVDSLGKTGSDYREKIYNNGFSERKAKTNVRTLSDFFDLTLNYIEHTIRANKREDGLYHAYNLISINENEISIDYLYEMLEGQVAALSAGYLSAEEAVEVLAALKNSSMFREDQYSYILYPDRDLPRYLNKNNIPSGAAEKSNLFATLLKDNNHLLIEKDVNGVYHFNGDIRNGKDVEDILESLSEIGYESLVAAEKDLILEIFEEMFDHKSFTGRSGTFFGYEGLGSIYWHMVSKLLLAAEEVYFDAKENGTSQEILDKLREQYYDVRQGIGFNKTPEEYGAYPSDPYSHTPAHAGAKQPGMTGQVKEDILSRFAELGVVVEDGKISIQPYLLDKNEFFQEGGEYEYFDLNGNSKTIKLEANQLFFTYCQVPIIYQLSDKNSIELNYKSGEKNENVGLELNREDSLELFNRTGNVEQIVVNLIM